MMPISTASSTTSEFGDEETASEAACEDREQGSSGDESDEEENRSSENGDVDDAQMNQVCVNPPLIHSLFLTCFRSFLSPFPGCPLGIFFKAQAR